MIGCGWILSLLIAKPLPLQGFFIVSITPKRSSISLQYLARLSAESVSQRHHSSYETGLIRLPQLKKAEITHLFFLSKKSHRIMLATKNGITLSASIQSGFQIFQETITRTSANKYQAMDLKFKFVMFRS